MIGAFTFSRPWHYADFKPVVKKGPFPCLYLKSQNRKAPHGYIEGLGCVQGGLVDLPQPFSWIHHRSTSPPWQISAGASYTPTVKNLSRGTSKSGAARLWPSVVWRTDSSTSAGNMSTSIRPSKKPPRFPKEALSHYFSFSSHTAIPTELHDS